MNRDGSDARPILMDYAVDASPSWGPDDRHIFFNSGRSGVSNIFAYSLEDQRLYQVTNVLSGNFDPVVSPDGKLLVCKEYSSNGMNIHLSELYPAQWVAMPVTSHTSSQTATERFTPLETSTETRYKALSTLWRPDPFPLWGSDEDGLQQGETQVYFRFKLNL